MHVLQVTVVRDGQACEVGTGELLVGDVMLLSTGDILPADGMLFEGADIRQALLVTVSPCPPACTTLLRFCSNRYARLPPPA